jgi:hypothetical protein
MNIPKVIVALVRAQNNFDCVAYANCFSETAQVVDEGKAYRGRKEIESWIASANEQYKTVMKPLSYKEREAESMLKALVSGNFAGSPVVPLYHVRIVDEQIQSLKITG